MLELSFVFAMLTAGPSPDAEVARVTAHLERAEAVLRAAPVEGLTSGARARRAALLDELRRYTAAQRFPRHRPGTVLALRPRWVDDWGRHCAVAHLVRWSGHGALVDRVQRLHELDYVADMRVPELATWASAHGFSVADLATIQPTYDHGGSVHVPSEHEEREMIAEARRRARIPRELTPEHVRPALVWLVSRESKRDCFGERTGHYRLRTRASFDRPRHIRVRVEVRSVHDDTRDAPLERCFTRWQRTIIDSFLAQANYVFARRVAVSHEQALDVYTREEVEAAFVADRRPWHRSGTRKQAIAECVARFPTTPVRVRILIASWNGEVRLDWPGMFPNRNVLALPRDEYDRWQCLQEPLIYARLDEHGLEDLTLTVDIDRSGTMNLVRARGVDH